MLCLTARSGDDVRRFPLPEEAATIGYAHDNDIVLPFLGVSRRHALLTRTGGSGFVLTDAGSKNGLIHDGARVPSLALGVGTRVQIGSAFLAIEDADTGELKIALTAEGAQALERDSAHTDSLAPRGTDADALALIGAIERRGAPRQHAQSILSEARAVLRATTLTLLEEGDGEHALVALAGEPLPPDVTVDAAKRLHQRREIAEEIYRMGDATIVLSGAARKGRAAMLVARFQGPPRAVTASERALLGYLAAKLVSPSRGRDDLRAGGEPFEQGGIVYASRQMRALLETVASIAGSPRPILIQGETGTGKELLARLLHDTGPYAAGRLLAVNCAEIPEDLIETELFGVERGVATGVEARPGLFTAADGGTLFLDEIGELPATTQALLLRVLERNEVRPVGSRTSRPVRLRVVLATRREIAANGESSGVVREDLFYRCVFLSIPPLRERRDDVVPLALHFLERACNTAGIERASVSEKAIRLLLDHDWPGNVRELEHAVEQAVLRFGRGGTLQSEHFTALLRNAPKTRAAAAPSLREEHDHIDRERVHEALRSTHGNKAAAARLLGLSRNGLAKLMARLGLS